VDGSEVFDQIILVVDTLVLFKFLEHIVWILEKVSAQLFDGNVVCDFDLMHDFRRDGRKQVVQAVIDGGFVE
jgi:hypothetical protein